MIPRLGLASLLLVLATLTLASTTSALERLTLPGLAGDSLSETDFDDRDALIVVWASWSPRCHDILERLEALEARWGDRLELVSVVFQEDADTVRGFLGPGHDGSPEVYFDLDGTFAKQVDVATLPTLLVVRSGEVVFRGRLPADPNPVIEGALAESL